MPPASCASFERHDWVDFSFSALAAFAGVGLAASGGVLALLAGSVLAVGFLVVGAGTVGTAVVVDDRGVSVRRAFKWRRTYPWSDVTSAVGARRWLIYPRSMPVIMLSNGSSLRLYPFSELSFHPPGKLTAAIVSAVNSHMSEMEEAGS